MCVGRLPTVLAIAVIVFACDVARGCPGDCDGDGVVGIAELHTGVALALERGDVAACAHIDGNGDGIVDVGELVAGVEAALHGCATASPSAALTASVAPAPTATAVLNRALQFACRVVYRTYPGFLIRVPLPVLDPDGDPLSFDPGNLPRGAHLDVSAGVLEWTPGERQLGAFFAPFTASEGTAAARSTAGLVAIQVAPLDPCTLPRCDPAAGCAPELLPLSTSCCDDADPHRLVEPLLACPNGGVLHVGRNGLSFGRMQNCDRMRVYNFAQTGAVVPLSVEVRCLDVSRPVELHARIETATRLLFDHTIHTTLTPEADGFARLRLEPFDVLGPGPFFEFEGADALISVAVTDADGFVLSRRVRVVLTFGRPEEFPDQESPAPRDSPDVCVAASIASRQMY